MSGLVTNQLFWLGASMTAASVVASWTVLVQRLMRRR